MTLMDRNIPSDPRSLVSMFYRHVLDAVWYSDALSFDNVVNSTVMLSRCTKYTEYFITHFVLVMKYPALVLRSVCPARSNRPVRQIRQCRQIRAFRVIRLIRNLL
jgi:hypothetical protein